MNKIVITGAAGFLGSHLADLFVARYPDSRFVFFDKMTYSADIENVVHHLHDRRRQLLVGDICDPEFCRQATAGADLVIHAAAESHVDRSFMNATRFVHTNVFGTHTLLEACRINQVPRIIHVSTDEVYGEVLEGEVDEDTILNPTNPYSASKAAAEMMVRSLIHCYKMPILMIRGNNIFGARQYPEKIISRFCLRLVRGEKLPIHGNGSNVRHYLAAQDMAEAIALINEVGTIGQVYNIGSDEEYTNLQVTRMICEILRRRDAGRGRVCRGPAVQRPALFDLLQQAAQPGLGAEAPADRGDPGHRPMVSRQRQALRMGRGLIP